MHMHGLAKEAARSAPSGAAGSRKRLPRARSGEALAAMGRDAAAGGEGEGERSPPMVWLHVERFPCALRLAERTVGPEEADRAPAGAGGAIADCVRHWL